MAGRLPFARPVAESRYAAGQLYAALPAATVGAGDAAVITSLPETLPRPAQKAKGLPAGFLTEAARAVCPAHEVQATGLGRQSLPEHR